MRHHRTIIRGVNTMKATIQLSILAATALISLCAGAQAQQGVQAPNMTFFVTSVGSGKGGDLGGLAGADAHCQELAASVGAGNKTWHAYLSTADTPAGKGINAKDRIGN